MESAPMPKPSRIGALLLPAGHLWLRRRDGILVLPPWQGRLRAAWVTETGTPQAFTQRVVLFDRRGVWLWPSPLLHDDAEAGGHADYAAFFAAIPVAARLRMAGEAVDVDPATSTIPETS